jgi:hypothetical protein
MPGGGVPIRETALADGDVNLGNQEVVRVGGRARRQVGPHTQAVAGLLSYFGGEPHLSGWKAPWDRGSGAEIVNRSAWFDAYRADLRRSLA